MRISKRFLSLALCLTIVLSMFTVLGIVSTAAEDGDLLNLEFNDLADTNGNVTIENFGVFASEGTDGGLTGTGSVSLNGTSKGWQKYGGFYPTYVSGTRPVYNPFAAAGDSVTVEMSVKPVATATGTYVLFGDDCGDFLMFVLKVTGSNLELYVNMDASSLSALDTSYTVTKTMEGAAPAVGEWSTVTLTQEKVDDVTTTIIYVNGVAVGKYEDIILMAEYLQVGKDSGRDDYFSIGSLCTAKGWLALNGEIDYFRVSAGAKTFRSQIDAAAVAAVEALISTAAAAANGSDAQMEAWVAANAAYHQLNVDEQEAVSNAADLDTIKAAYIHATGNLLSLEYNGTLADTFGRYVLTSLSDLASEGTDGGLTGNGTVALNGNSCSSWDKKGGFTRRDYSTDPFTAAGDSITVEMRVKPAAYAEGKKHILFGDNWGGNLDFTFYAADGNLVLYVKLRDTEVNQLGDAAVTAGTWTKTMEGAAPAVGEWSTVTLTQEKADGVTTTMVYVNGEAVGTFTDVVLLADFVRVCAQNNYDDFIGIGSACTYSGEKTNVAFHGEIDYFRVFDDVKTFAADPLTETAAGVSSVPADVIGTYDLTWNVDVTNRLDDADAQDFVEFNAQYTILDTGVIIAATAGDAEDAKALAASEDTAIAGKAYQESFGTTLYSHFSYRRMNVAAGRTRYVVAYTVYTDGENTYYAYADAVALLAE